MARYIHIVERNSFFNSNGCDYRGGASNSDIRVFAKKSLALAHLADEISASVCNGGGEFERYEYNQDEINVTTIKELVVYAQQQYNKFGWRVTYTYRKQLIEIE
jgi:hypothetical protein